MERSMCSPEQIAVPDVLGARVLRLTAIEYHNHTVAVNEGVPTRYSLELSYCGVNMWVSSQETVNVDSS